MCVCGGGGEVEGGGCWLDGAGSGGRGAAGDERGKQNKTTHKKKKSKKIRRHASCFAAVVSTCAVSVVETEEKPSLRRRTMTSENRTRNIIQ